MDLTEAVGQGLADLPEADAAVMEKQHADFLAAFPIEAWPDMSVEQYALGTESTRKSYSYALEWGTSKLGSISGGSALKHVIFRRRRDGQWHYPVGHANVEEAWAALRQAFLTVIDLASRQRWSEISGVPMLQGATVVTLKTLYLYFPQEFVPVYSKEHLRRFATKVGASLHEDPVLLNRAVLARLRELPGAAELDGQRLATLLYRWAPPSAASSSVVKIAPGPGGDQWDDCLANGYICVGWDDVGDLSLYETEEDFRSAFAAAYPYNGNQSQITRKAKELWTLTTLRAGDRIIANRGTSEVLAVGTVKDPAYEWRQERTEYQHTVAVDWDTSLSRRLNLPVKQWATTTVLAVPKALATQLLNPPTADPSSEAELTLDALYEDPYADWARILERKKQVIFYGPPGTGKTYAARGFARWWLARELGYSDSSLSTIDALDRELTAPGTGRNAWWMQRGSQDAAWEELFARGHLAFRRGTAGEDYSSVQSGDVVVCWEPSPTNRAIGLARVVACHTDDPSDETPLRLIPIRRLARGVSWQEMVTDPALRDSAPVRLGGRQGLIPLTADQLTRVAEISGVEAPGLQGETTDVAGYLTQLTFHASYSYEEFVEGYRPVAGTDGLSLELRHGVVKRVAATAAADEPAPYVLLLDEINRANVPRVFGELLTVIEADKRGMEVTLPASGQRLAIPGNLHLIGTMNTADRSIRTLDAALRRRFAFIELMPKPELLNGTSIDGLELDVFLRELNRRITKHAGRERQVGHSFFLRDGVPIQDADTLADVLRLEVIPLLQEIAFDDYGQLERYLGKQLIDASEQRLTAVVDDDKTLIDALAKEYANPVDAGD